VRGHCPIDCKAIEQGYVVNDADKPGQPMRLRAGDDLPEGQVILPPPEAVERCCTVAVHSDPPQGGGI
jgi:hypothetical protein